MRYEIKDAGNGVFFVLKAAIYLNTHISILISNTYLSSYECRFLPKQCQYDQRRNKIIREANQQECLSPLRGNGPWGYRNMAIILLKQYLSSIGSFYFGDFPVCILGVQAGKGR